MNRPLARTDLRAGFKARFTTAEFMDIVGSGAFGEMRIELARGELERINPPMNAHGFAQIDVGFRLRMAVAGLAERYVYGEVGLDLGNDTVRACDVAIASVLPIQRRLLRPEELVLVVEVADDTLARDLGPKSVDYAAAGIPAYWVVDVNARAVTVMCEPSDDGYVRRDVVRFGEPFTVPGTDATITL